MGPATRVEATLFGPRHPQRDLTCRRAPSTPRPPASPPASMSGRTSRAPRRTRGVQRWRRTRRSPAEPEGQPSPMTTTRPRMGACSSATFRCSCSRRASTGARRPCPVRPDRQPWPTLAKTTTPYLTGVKNYGEYATVNLSGRYFIDRSRHQQLNLSIQNLFDRSYGRFYRGCGDQFTCATSRWAAPTLRLPKVWPCHARCWAQLPVLVLIPTSPTREA